MLTDMDRAALDLEGRMWRYAAVKEEAIRATGTTPTRHYQRVTRLLDDPDALAYAPVTVNRLRRLRDTGSRGRRLPQGGGGGVGAR